MRFVCECGKWLSNSNEPNIEYRVYSDKEWYEKIVENEEITEPILIPYPEHHAWLCPDCQRIHIWKTDSPTRVALYELVKQKKPSFWGRWFAGARENLSGRLRRRP